MTYSHIPTPQQRRVAAFERAQFEGECRRTAARMNDDMQEILLLVEEKARAWAVEGLLDKRRQKSARTTLRTDAEAVAWLVAMVRESLMDAHSMTAQEAREVAGV